MNKGLKLKIFAILLVTAVAAALLSGCTATGEQAYERLRDNLAAVRAAAGAEMTVDYDYKKLDVSECAEDDYSKAKLKAWEDDPYTGEDVKLYLSIFCDTVYSRDYDGSEIAVTYSKSGAKQVFVVKYKSEIDFEGCRYAYHTVGFTFKDGRLLLLEALEESVKELPYKNKLTGKAGYENTVMLQRFVSAEFNV